MTGGVDRLRAALLDRYRVERELGVGGMATVYLAEDLKHRRKVALKVLRPELAAILGVERFLNEIEVTANLQHPNILPLYDSGKADTFLFYVMPHVAGESLRDRLRRDRQLPIDEAVAITRLIAGALDYAHRHGVIHRDIKPENILFSEGQALVADFGITLAVSTAGGSRMTETGMSLGTPHYMSPEQAMGERALDARSDVYALGVVAYEMLVGEPPFTGPTPQAILAKVVTTEPVAPAELRHTIPPYVDAAVRTALAKVPADRFATAAEFSAALVNPAFTQRTSGPGVAAKPAHKSWRTRARFVTPWILALVGIGMAVIAMRRTLPRMPVMYATIPLPPGVTLPMDTEHSVLALSPNGSRLVFVGEERGKRRLYIRELAETESRPIAETDGAAAPFFSPDGAWIGFFEGMTLKKVSAYGGVPVAVHDVHGIGVNRGATWSGENHVVLARSVNSGLSQLSVAGDRRRPIDEAVFLTKGVEPYAWPDAIPGGRDVLFTNNVGGRPQNARVALLAIESGETKTLVNGGTSPRYSPTGHVLFARAGSLFAIPFDAGRGATRGSETKLLDSLMIESWGAAHFAVSANGVLAYVTGDPVAVEHELVWVDRRGQVEPLLDVGRTFFDLRLSPDGRRLAFSSPDGANYDIWILDLARRGALTRVTSHLGEDLNPVWSPNGKMLAFASEVGEDGGESGPGLAWITVSTGRLERLFPTPPGGHLEFPSSWSPDGHWLAFKAERPGALGAIFVLPTSGVRQPVALLGTAGNQAAPAFSPDGRWIAYVSDVSGRDEVYILEFPGGQESIRISTNGGVEPVWLRNGQELFYREDDRMMAVRPREGSWSSPTTPKALFEGRFEKTRWGAGAANYDVSPEGGRFVMVRRKNSVAPVVIHLLLNWPEVLRTRSSRTIR